MNGARGPESGLSLVEALVGTAVMSIAIIVALTVYDASRKAFAKSENATEQQQSVRIAFDKLSTEIRMLGFNVDPDGNPNRPDEQLEGALDHAIVFRADFDRDDPTASLTPETSLAGGAFPTVSTGNDEIVAYVLSNPDGTGPDSITFQADVREAKRDGTVEPVTIGNVVLNPTSPPYTLYRISLNNDASKYGSPAFIVRTPVADNVRNLTFTYCRPGGTFTDPASTIPETPEAKAARASLLHVHVSLVGMTRQPDLAYNDPNDPATASYRKFEIAGDITPRNMRLKGVIDLNADVTPPGKPGTPTLIPGHCGGLVAIWPANPAGDGVTQYRISWGTGGVQAGARNVPGSPYYLDGLSTGSSYSVWIQAQDAQGNVSVKSDPATATVTNLNTPSQPTGLAASTDKTYQVAVSFAPVTTNSTNVPTTDPQAPKIRDLAGYRLYWSPNADTGFTLLVDETTLTPAFTGTYADTPVAACVNRYYHLTAIDTCGIQSEPAVAVGSAADSGVAPKPPDHVQAHYVGTDPSAPAQINWVATTQDVSGHAILLDTYQVFRSPPVNDSGVPPPLSGNLIGTVDDALAFTDQSPPHLKKQQVVYYIVRAQDACGNVSDDSVPAKLECAFGGNVAVSMPAGAHVVGNPIRVSVSVSSPTDPSYNLIAIEYDYSPATPGCSETDFYTDGGTSWTKTWTPPCAGTYTITATVQTVLPVCAETATASVTISK